MATAYTAGTATAVVYFLTGFGYELANNYFKHKDDWPKDRNYCREIKELKKDKTKMLSLNHNSLKLLLKFHSFFHRS